MEEHFERKISSNDIDANVGFKISMWTKLLSVIPMLLSVSANYFEYSANFTHPKTVVGIENASFTVRILHVILNEKVKSHSFKQLWAVSNIFLVELVC